MGNSSARAAEAGALRRAVGSGRGEVGAWGQQEWVDSGNGWAVGVGGQRELEALGGEGSGTMNSGSQGMER